MSGVSRHVFWGGIINENPSFTFCFFPMNLASYISQTSKHLKMVMISDPEILTLPQKERIEETQVQVGISRISFADLGWLEHD